jgi:dienelactone hydrolase
MPSTVRFLRQYLLPRESAVVREETTYRRGDQELPASLYRPTGAAQAPAGAADGRDGEGGLPGWVALHGITYRGREHESLVGFARALAASGAAVLVPDIPEWRALRVAPEAAAETIAAAVLELGRRPFTAPGRVGVIGFSFGGTHALLGSTASALDGHLAAVVSWGGYADLHRTLRFAFTGEHELDGERHRLEPDPYGRWIFAGNYLRDTDGYGGAGDVAGALLWLAREVGRRKLWAWEPTTDPLKAEARAELDGDDRALFDLIAPATANAPSPDRDRLGVLADRLAAAARARDPLLDPSDGLPRVAVPVFLAHGRDDRLIPWTELPRLRRVLPDARVRHAMVTELFAHSAGERWIPTPSKLVEALRFVRGLNRMVHLL